MHAGKERSRWLSSGRQMRFRCVARPLRHHAIQFEQPNLLAWSVPGYFREPIQKQIAGPGWDIQEGTVTFQKHWLSLHKTTTLWKVFCLAGMERTFEKSSTSQTLKVVRNWFCSNGTHLFRATRVYN